MPRSCRRSCEDTETVRFELDQPPAMLHRSGRTLEQAHDLQPCAAAGDGLSTGLDAVNKVLELYLERLRNIELRSEHIAGAVSDHGTIDTVRSIRQRDALVIDLDLFTGLHVVVHDHLFASADQGAAHLNRG